MTLFGGIKAHIKGELQQPERMPSTKRIASVWDTWRKSMGGEETNAGGWDLLECVAIREWRSN